MDLQRIVALVPMKPLSACKSRLSDCLSPSQRRTLSLNMLRCVLRTLQSTNTQTWVVGGDDPIERLAREHGACWLNEEGRSLNESLSMAFDRALERADAAVYLPGDLPFITTDDVVNVVSASRRMSNAVIAPERRGDGTNALLMTGKTRFRLSLGPDSFRCHQAQAAACDIPIVTYDSEGLGYDLDTVADLEFDESFKRDHLRRLLTPNEERLQ